MRRRHTSRRRHHGRVGPARGDADRLVTAVSMFDAIVIGAGSNGLVAAAALGKAGRRVLVVESAERSAGSGNVEFAPGFRAPLSADTGWLPPAVARGLALPAIGATTPSVVASVAGDGGFSRFTVTSVAPRMPFARHSSRDAERWSSFTERLGKLAGFLEALYQLPPPTSTRRRRSASSPRSSLGRKFRALGRADMTRVAARAADVAPGFARRLVREPDR